MLRHKLYSYFSLLLVLPITSPQVAQAQYITPYLGKPHQIRPDLYKKQKDGTVYDTTTGNIYDTKGNLIRRRNDTSDTTTPSNSSQSSPRLPSNSGVRTPLPANPAPQLKTPLPNPQAGFILTDNTPVKLRFKETITSKTAQENQLIEFEVAEDVLVNGITVIPRGVIAKGIIAEVKRARMLGRRGKINIILKEVQISSGERVALRASTGKGGGLSGGTIALSAIVTPLFLLMGGKEAKYTAGTEFSAFVDGDYALDPSKFGSSTAPMAPRP
jgi:hypothetical protein